MFLQVSNLDTLETRVPEWLIPSSQAAAWNFHVLDNLKPLDGKKPCNLQDSVVRIKPYLTGASGVPVNCHLSSAGYHIEGAQEGL